MIPWRLTFSGIRDYPPTLLDLSGHRDHVLITGPNGAGKSTLTFCMGAVLHSAKVDIDGLKSRNLLPEETWRAKIALLFHNKGKTKIDAPSFIEFSLKIVKEPRQPIKKEYTISSGETVDEWEKTVRYTSGGENNFSDYKRALQYKYKIQPDFFYLIWYQQEVNQFATMHPEERFRVFSEMYGIDKVQQNWEESIEKVKETKETVRMAEVNVKVMKQELEIKRRDLDRYHDNQRRYREGGTQYLQSLLQLEKYYKIEIERLEQIVAQLEEDIIESKDDLVDKRVSVEQKREEIRITKLEQEKLEETIRKTECGLMELNEKIKDIQEGIDELDNELADITERSSRIKRTEGEVKAQLAQLSEAEKETKVLIEKNQTNLEKKKSASQSHLQTIAKLEAEIEKDEKEEKDHKERLRQYKSSYDVHIFIQSLDESIKKNKNTMYTAERQLSEWKNELKLLEEKRHLSSRQQESLKYFRMKGIKAYPLRELLELEKGARLEDEHIFDTIKYTIFFNGKEAIPPNDLYHVPLMNIVPKYSVESLLDLRLRIKENLPEELIPVAIKALWWVEQFFKENPLKINNGVLIDSAGYRGPQEKPRYILSENALQERKKKLEALILELEQQLKNLQEKIYADMKKFQELNSIIHQVKQSEAFMTIEYERVLRKQKLAEEKVLKVELDKEIKRLEDEKYELQRKQIEKEILRKELEEEEKVYAELGKMKEKYEKRNALLQQLEDKNLQKRNMNRKLSEFNEENQQLDRKLEKLEREKRKHDLEIEYAEENISLLKKQKILRYEEQEVNKHKLVEIIHNLEKMKQWIPKLYQEVSRQVDLKNLPSLAQMTDYRENGWVTFQNARNELGIDPAAPENYKTIKQEYERLENEFRRTKILLEQDKERTESLKDKLETTINMRVLELNKLFQKYMSRFQFEGLIEWKQHEDNRKRIHFHLYIKARKEGHRGELEDVSIKARGGKVGKGVSGGEESLSSLLFALALLQNLQTSPGFIVLDEFDSALDEERKTKVFDLYEQELKRKMIILTPKSHESDYLNRFSKAFIVHHDPTVPSSKVIGIVKTNG